MQAFPDGQQRALHYRYKCEPMEKVNAFKPKELDPNLDRRNMRAAMLGAVWCKKLNKIPASNWLKVIWEASSYFLTGFFQKLGCINPNDSIKDSILIKLCLIQF